MERALLFALLVLVPPAFGRGQVWVVAPLECSGVDFQTIQEAVDAASDGDTILVRPRSTGSYGSFEIVQKSLTVAAAEPNLASTGLYRLGDLTIRDLLPQQSVTIIGTASGTIGELRLVNNQGPVWISGFTVSASSPGTPPFRETVLAEDCASVTIVRGFIYGRSYSSNCPPVGSCLGADAPTCMRVVNSALHMFEGWVFGSKGGPGYDPFDPGVPAGRGGDAVWLQNSEFNAFRAFAVRGGSGGVGGQAFPAPFCSDGGDGGHGIVVSDTSSTVRLIDTPVDEGAGGLWTTGTQVPNGCSNGNDGLPISGPGAGSELILPGERRSAGFGDGNALTEGQASTIGFRGLAGELAFLGVAVDQFSTFDPVLSAVLSIQPVTVLSVGAIPPNTIKTVPITVGDLTNPGEAVTVFIQPYFVDATLQLHVGSPDAAVIVDATQSLYDGCDVPVYVDDDAPGDPGPGDPDVSDPLEDGSRLHPFDSIQEAIYSVTVAETHVVVADGTYTTTGSTLGLDVDNRTVLIESENGPENCIVDLQGLGAFVRFRESSLTLDHGVKGFTLRNALGFAIRCNAVDVTVEDCVFEDGSGTLGAGLRMSSSSMVVKNCVFRNNVASSQGGAIYIDSSTPFIENCTVQDNSAPIGGGIYVSDEGSLIRGCTIVGNSGGGLFYDTPATALLPHVLENSIVWGNTGANQIELTDGVLELPYGNVQGGLAGITILQSGVVNAGPGLIDLDPLFVDELGGDYHIGASSPCVDAGDPLFVPAPGETDIDGQPRLMGTAVDLGSDEL